MNDHIERLRDDDDYYGDFGRQFMSNSDIGTLLNNPKEYGNPKETSKEMLIGRYFHQSILEPDKIRTFPIVSASTRNTNIYKDFLVSNGIDKALLQSEVDEIDVCVLAMTSNLDFYGGIRQLGNQYEVPMIKEIKGVLFKGKADILCTDKIIDLKTTTSIEKFKYSANTYNYDSQCYIYEQLYDVPLVFYVVDKVTQMLGIFSPTEAFIDRGEQKVIKAIEMRRRYFGPNKIADPIDYFIEQDLH